MSKFDYLSKENTILRKKLRKLEEAIRTIVFFFSHFDYEGGP